MNLKKIPFKKILRILGGPYSALVILLLVCSLTSANFAQPENLINIMRQVSYSGMIALGMTFVIVGGGIDLSVGSLFALCGVFCVLAMNKWSVPLAGQVSWLSPDTAGLLIAFVISLATAITGGAINGLSIILGHIPPFIATLGTYSIFRSLALYFADSGTLSCSNAMLENFAGAEFLGLPAPAWFLFILVFLLAGLMNMTSFGRHVCAVGSNERVARFACIPVNWTKLATYLIVTFCVGLSAVMFTGRLGSISSSNAGMLYELDAVAAVIIGGAAMSGGRGSLFGTLAGIFILGIVSNVLDMWGVSVTLQGLVKGLVIIISVIIQRKEKTV